MAQFDVHALGTLKVVDLQSDIIGLDKTRLVAPLRVEGKHEYLPRLTPRVTFDEQVYVVHIHDMAVVASRQLGPILGSLSDATDELLRATDILTRGF